MRDYPGLELTLVPPAVIDPEVDIDTCNRVMMTLGGCAFSS